MKKCSLCQKKEKPGSGSFFRVPKDDRRVKWSQSCGINFPRNAFLCMDHFAASCLVNTGQRLVLLPNSVPLVPIDNPIAATAKPFESRRETTNYFSTQKSCDTSVGCSTVDEMQFEVTGTQFCEKGTQTDPVALDYSIDHSLYLKKVQHLKCKIKELERCLTKANAALDTALPEGLRKKSYAEKKIIFYGKKS